MTTKRLIAGMMLLASATGCANLGSWEEILSDAAGGLYGNDVSGEIRQIDTRRQRIELESGWGDAERVRYDSRTAVYYGQRRYDVRDLECGDRVRVQLDDATDREPYARVIRVESSYRDRDDRNRDDRDRNGRVERLDGRVDRIDTRQGWFEVTASGGTVITVSLPYEPNRTLVDRFRRLRRGDRVRVEGERLNYSRMVLHRFL